jgi:hypothetical protein
MINLTFELECHIPVVQGIVGLSLATGSNIIVAAET